jgi:enoyl-CoA hydratase
MDITYEFNAETQLAELHLDDGKANVMSTPWFQEFEALLSRAEADEAAAVLFRGRSGMFSGGLNMKWLPTLDGAALRELLEAFSSAMLRVFALPLPTVVAVTGHAVAGGCVLASACDRRFALDGPYRIQMNEVLVGMPLPTWAVTICREAWPIPQVNDLLLLGQPFSPQEALAAGMLHGVAATEPELLATARAAAQALRPLQRQAFALTRRRMRAPAVQAAKARLYEDWEG